MMKVMEPTPVMTTFSSNNNNNNRIRVNESHDDCSRKSAMVNGEIDCTLRGSNNHIHLDDELFVPKDDSATLLAHPSLKALQIQDVDSNATINPNAAGVTRISNEWFDCDFIIMLRTPNVDNPSSQQQPHHHQGTPANAKVSNYFKNRKRRFEFQYQVKLKKKPDNKDLCFSIELGQPLKLGILQKALVTTCLVFMKKTSPTFHYTMNGTPPTNDGNYEIPHMAFAVETCLDRLVVTKPGDVPPKLGTEIKEDLEHAKKRRAGKVNVDWNVNDTYTMSLWSHYIDFINWECVNIPGVKHFPLTTILGNQPVYMALYLLDAKRNEKSKHYQRDIERVVNLEFSHKGGGEKKKESMMPKFFRR